MCIAHPRIPDEFTDAVKFSSWINPHFATHFLISHFLFLISHSKVHTFVKTASNQIAPRGAIQFIIQNLNLCSRQTLFFRQHATVFTILFFYYRIIINFVILFNMYKIYPVCK